LEKGGCFGGRPFSCLTRHGPRSISVLIGISQIPEVAGSVYFTKRRDHYKEADKLFDKIFPGMSKTPPHIGLLTNSNQNGYHKHIEPDRWGQFLYVFHAAMLLSYRLGTLYAADDDDDDDILTTPKA
jgi:hypothetical protein